MFSISCELMPKHWLLLSFYPGSCGTRTDNSIIIHQLTNTASFSMMSYFLCILMRNICSRFISPKAIHLATESVFLHFSVYLFRYIL
jgi:hypothetical protein